MGITKKLKEPLSEDEFDVGNGMNTNNTLLKSELKIASKYALEIRRRKIKIAQAQININEK